MKLPQWIVPALVGLCAAAGIGAARLVTVPSVVRDFTPAPGNSLRTTVFVVDGVKCVDTAERAARQLEGVRGVVRFVAFAARNRVEITFDPTRTDVSKILEAVEAPVYENASGEYLFGVYDVVEVDGVKVVNR